MKKSRTTRTFATDETIEELLLNSLKEIPFVQVKHIEQRIVPQTGRPEIIAKIQIGNNEKLVLAEVKANGQPRLVREAVRDIAKYRETFLNAYGIIIAPDITPNGARICKSEGVGYLDLSGNCLFNFDLVFVHKTGRTDARRSRKSRSWYSPRAERVLRSLLNFRDRHWTIHQLAEESLVTPNQALAIKNLLVEKEWLVVHPDGFALVHSDLLLDEWSTNYVPRRSVERLFHSPRSVVEIEAALADICQQRTIPYSLMGFSAATRYTPFVHYDRVCAYVMSDLSQVISALDLTEVQQGANVSLWTPYDEGVLFGNRRVDWMRITSPVQTYLDLITAAGHGEKVANSIWQNHIQANAPATAHPANSEPVNVA